MPIHQAKFPVSISPAPTVAVSVDWMTVDESATSYADYIQGKGTLVFPVGVTTQNIVVNLRHPIEDLALKAFKVVLSNPQNAALGTASSECRISGPPAYAAVPFPGPRLAALGDSITYANNGYNPLVLANIDPNAPSAMRNSYFSTGMTGFIAYANALLGHPFELETGMQPNTNPGANSTASFHGYNFAIYSSQTQQWLQADFDPIPNDNPVTHNVGPMLNARNYLSKFDIAIIMGGTNDLSAGVAPSRILLNIQNYAYELAEAGKWVFILTITPRTGDLLGGSGNNPGYNIDDQKLIMLNIQQVNQALRDWVATTAPANIWLVDSYAKLLGPNASLIPGNPTDPFGLTSATTATMGTTTDGRPMFVTKSTPGNYRSDAPGVLCCYDGLHPAPAGGYIIGKDLAAALKTACGTSLPPPATSKVGPLTIGANLMANGANSLAIAGSPSTPQPSRVPPAAVVLGRAIGLGAPLTDATHPPSPGSDVPTPGGDARANHGLGYTHGPVPNNFALYRSSNNDGESFSNFNNYTFSQFVAGLPALQPFMVDSTWADGCLKTSLVNEVINGVATPGFKMVFQAPAGLTHNEAFVLRYVLAEGQNNVWNNYGYEGTAQQRANPAPPYNPGEFVAGDMIVRFEGVNGGLMSSNLTTSRLCANFISYNPNNNNTSSAVVSGIAFCESYFPFDNVAVVHQHPEAKLLTLRTPAVAAPTPAAGETLVKLHMDLQISFDCSTVAASATITVFAPRIAKLTGPAL